MEAVECQKQRRVDGLDATSALMSPLLKWTTIVLLALPLTQLMHGHSLRRVKVERAEPLHGSNGSSALLSNKHCRSSGYLNTIEVCTL